jgi:translation initiation factor IF-3
MVSPGAAPPVCRIADIGKLKYEQNKKEKEARKAQKGGGLKEIKLSPKIAQHDFEVRVAKAKECLVKHFKVKVSVYFRGREMAHMDLGRAVIERFIAAVSEEGKVEAPPKAFGKSLILVLAPK